MGVLHGDLVFPFVCLLLNQQLISIPDEIKQNSKIRYEENKKKLRKNANL